MKKLTFLFILLCCGGNAFSQYEVPSNVKLSKFHVLDSAYLKFTYRFTYVQDSLKADSTRKVDVQSLLVGKNVSKYFSQKYLAYCQKCEAKVYERIESGTCGFEIYKNHQDKKMTITDLGTYLASPRNMLYEEEIPNLKWEIKNDTLTVLSYTCQKAITTFRGRVYEAWFSADIPINNGPWKFGGLPGLILKINDMKQDFIFECIGVENLKKMEPVRYYDLTYNKVNRKNLDKLYQRYLDDSAFYILSNDLPLSTSQNHSPKKPYNPIELE